MSAFAALAVAIIGLAALVMMARRDRRAVLAGRARLLDGCRPLFDQECLSLGPDGFARLDGRIGGRRLVLELIPDTMTIRRLPQLWMSVTMIQPLPLAARFGVLARPSGAEFYALTPGFDRRLDPPPGLPPGVLVRGSSSRACEGLAAAGRGLAGLFADPRVKEVVATKSGLRIVFRLAEGERGAHLILRQCVFRDASASPSDLLSLFDAMVGLGEAIAGPGISCIASGSGATR